MFREVLINAIDAHREAGQTKPVDIKLPTSWDEVMYIRDYGKGLPHQQLLDIYLAYGTSTRRDSNEQHGGLGLGTKSPLAYTSSFSVVSVHDGIRNEYLIYYDDDNLPCVDHRDTRPSFEESGLTVSLTMVSTNDYKQFREAAVKILSRIPSNEYRIANESVVAFTPGELSLKNGIQFANAVIRDRDSNAKERKLIVTMGYVAYEVDSKAVVDFANSKNIDIKIEDLDVSMGRIIENILDKRDLELKSEIGEFPVHPSREYINVTPRTVKLIQRYLMEMIAELFKKNQGFSYDDDLLMYTLIKTLPEKKGSAKIRARLIECPAYSWYSATISKQINTYLDLIEALYRLNKPIIFSTLSADHLTDYLGGGRHSFDLNDLGTNYSSTNILFMEKSVVEPAKLVIKELDRRFQTTDLQSHVDKWLEAQRLIREQRDSLANVPWAPPRVKRDVPKLMKDPSHNILLLKKGMDGSFKRSWESVKETVTSLKAKNKPIFWVPTKLGIMVDHHKYQKMLSDFNDIFDVVPHWKQPIIIGLPATKGTKTLEKEFQHLGELEKWLEDFQKSDYFVRRMSLHKLYTAIFPQLYPSRLKICAAYGDANLLFRLHESARKLRGNYRILENLATNIVLDNDTLSKYEEMRADVRVKFPDVVAHSSWGRSTLNDDLLKEWAEQVSEYTNNKPTGAKQKNDPYNF